MGSDNFKHSFPAHYTGGGMAPSMGGGGGAPPTFDLILSMQSPYVQC